MSIGLLLTVLFVSCSHLGQPCNAYQRRQQRSRTVGTFHVTTVAAFGHHTHSNLLGSKRTIVVSPNKLKRHHSPTTARNNRIIALGSSSNPENKNKNNNESDEEIAFSSSSNNPNNNNNNNSESEKEETKNKKKTTTSKKKGYKFGDLTKSFARKVTKKDDYEFGDLSKDALDQAKTKINQVTQKEDYEFGDLSRYIDSRVKDQVAVFANKEEYEFGDVSKEIVRRVASRDYSWGDMVVLLKVLLSFGVGFSPIASLLPMKFLIDLLNYSIYADVGDRFVGAVTMEVDKKMKKAFTGDPEYQVGDLAKRAVLGYLDKDEYSFGDVTKKVLESIEENKKKDVQGDTKTKDGKSSATKSLSFLGELDEGTSKELETWDTKILQEAELAKKNEDNLNK